MSHLRPERADVIVLFYWDEEGKKRALNELVVAPPEQCARELKIPLKLVRAASVRLVKDGSLTTPRVATRAWVTKYKLGVGFRAHLANKTLRAHSVRCALRRYSRRTTWAGRGVLSARKR